MLVEIMKYYFVFALITLLFAGCVNENNNSSHQKKITEKKIVDLSKRWKFSLGDDAKWKEEKFDDSKWERIAAPASWENQGFHGYDGYAWYRTTFSLNEKDFDKDLYIVLGYIDDVDQTYINGKLIGLSGGFPKNYRTAYNAFRKYYIPNEYLNKSKENTIAVRIYDNELDGGIVSGNIGIFAYEGGIEPDINLSGVWDFTLKDSLFLKENYKDSSFEKLMVPAHWDVQGFQDYDGFGWYKKTFTLPDKYSGKNMILLLGKIDDIDQTYVNGILVGSTGNWNFKDVPASFNENEEYRINRVYSVPQKIFKVGKENTIVVRVYDGFRDGGIYDGPIGLITQDNYKKYFGKSN